MSAPIEPTLIILLGPTGVGKTDLSIALAQRLACPVVSADSRQIFRELPVGTAAPTAEELGKVEHWFIGNKSVEEDYNAGQYEAEVLPMITGYLASHEALLMVGGSMMYIDAVCKGFDYLPQVPQTVRQQVRNNYEAKGLEWLQSELMRLDPDYCRQVDLQNPQRLMHAVEISLVAGKPYSAFRTGTAKKRPFRILKVGLQRDRAELYERINRRVAQMMAQGLLQEAEKVYPYRHKNSLNTVGYKELFAYIDGKCTLDEAVDKIRQNSRHYAKRQLTWFRQDTEIHWFDAGNVTVDDIIQLYESSK